MSRSFSDFNSLTSILAGTATVAAIVISQPTAAIAKAAQEVAQIAQMTTVQINNSLDNPGGSGAIVAKKGNTYTVLTANHVVLYSDAQYTIVTSKEKPYRATKVQRLQTSKDAPDLALVTFESSEDYPVAPLTNSDQAVIGADIYVGGYPLPSLGAGKQREFTFSTGIVSARPESRPQGYTLRYNATTRVGMSGGPVFDIEGRVVGIHGQADIDDSVAGDSGATIAIKTGFNAGIPINTFMALKSQVGLSALNVAVDNTPTSDNPTARLSNPQSAKDYYARGLARFDQDDFPGAIENYTQSLRLDANFADAYSKRGAARLLLTDDSLDQWSLPKNKAAIQEALKDFNQALRLNPNDAYAYAGRGYISYSLGEKQAAMEDVNQALRLDPNGADGYNLRGILRSDLDDYQGAIADFNQAIRLNPNLYYAYSNRSIAHSVLKDYQGAIEDANQAVRIKPNSALAYLVRAIVRFRLEDYQGAVEDFNQSVRINPDYATAYFVRGSIRFEYNDYQGAIEDFNQVLKINPNYADAYANRAAVYVKQEDYRRAMEDANQALKLNPNSANAYLLRGVLRNSQGDKQGGLGDLQKAANLYLQQGNTKSYQNALNLIKKLGQ
jgi:tetratricopeptide (TPR) repeat protein/V8-like Glu-specific endopeptidase